MTVKLATALVLAAATLVPAFAQAQTRAAARPTAAAAPASATANAITGQPIAGICVYNDDRAVATSSVGKAAAARMQALKSQTTAELQGEASALQTDAKAFEAKRATLSAQQLQAQAQPLQQRQDALERKAQLRSRELEATGGRALQQIHTAIVPIVSQISSSRNCSVLLNGESVMAVNPAMDVTDAVVAQLNTRMSTITFDRANLAAQAGAGR